MNRILLSLCACAMLGANASAQSAPTTDPQTSSSVTVKYSGKVTLKYLIALPRGYDAKSKNRWPVLLFLHGYGERGSNPEVLKNTGIPYELAHGHDLPFIVVSPQCPDGGGWWANPTLLTAVDGLMNKIEREFHVDKEREYVTGLSMGGYGTWALTAMFPDRFAAMAPICGGPTYPVDPFDVTKLAGWSHIPMWVIHGDQDPIVPIGPDRDLADAVRKAGGDVKFETVVGGQHDVWVKVYAANDIYDWLLRHRRTGK